MPISFQVPRANGGIDSYVKLMLHGDESPLVDSSLTPQSLFINGGVARSATQSKFGGYSIGMPTNATNVGVISSDFLLPGDFTFDFWMYPSSGSTPATVYSQGSDINNFFEMFNDRLNGRFYVRLRDLGTYYVNTSFFYTPNDWSHFAVTGDGSNIRAYENGVLQFTDSYSTSQMPPVTTVRIGRDLYINRAGGVGYIDEFRFSNGIVRWTSDFTPPTQPYF